MATNWTEVTVGAQGEGPYGVTLVGDDVWTTLVHAGAVTRLSPATGAVERFEVGGAGSKPMVVVAGPDGGVWFTRNGDDRIGRVAADGTVSEYEAAGAPYGVCAGPDGALWFTLMNVDKVGR